MRIIESIQNLVPWLAGLPILPKSVISIIIVLVVLFFLMLIWTPRLELTPSKTASVIEAYSRMRRVLSKLEQDSSGTITFDGKQIPERIEDYFIHYIAIGKYLRNNPNDIDGAYEIVWEHGGQGRISTNSTQALESVVSAFFTEYMLVKEGKRDTTE